jgi:hypothetical protein
MFLKHFTLAALVAIVSGQAFALNEGLRYHLRSMEHGKAAAYRFDAPHSRWLLPTKT